MREHVIREAPIEACGLLGGCHGVVQMIFPVYNILQSPTRYTMKPQDQIDAMLKIEAQGLDLLGIYHSHPQGTSYPSPTDIIEAYYPEAAYIIWSPGENGWDCRAYCLSDGIVQEIPIKIYK